VFLLHASLTFSKQCQAGVQKAYKRTGATDVGHESATNLLRAHRIPADRLVTVRGGEDYEFEKFSLKVIPNLHSPLNRKRYFDDRTIPADIPTPLRLRHFGEGGSLCYLIRIGGHEILAFGSMNYIEREMVGLHPDVVLVGAGPSRVEIHDYVGRLMRALGFPAVVIPTHWDNYNIPYEGSQALPLKELMGFVHDVKVVSPKTRVVVPDYFKPIVLERQLRTRQ
jgi:L-ascorbate metabolism protein UlaG (beta-lactamase superfamily)